jgi:hypothetical protein
MVRDMGDDLGIGCGCGAVAIRAATPRRLGKPPVICSPLFRHERRGRHNNPTEYFIWFHHLRNLFHKIANFESGKGYKN